MYILLCIKTFFCPYPTHPQLPILSYHLENWPLSKLANHVKGAYLCPQRSPQPSQLNQLTQNQVFPEIHGEIRNSNPVPLRMRVTHPASHTLGSHKQPQATAQTTFRPVSGALRFVSSAAALWPSISLRPAAVPVSIPLICEESPAELRKQVSHPNFHPSSP